MTHPSELAYLIALSMVPQIGGARAKELISHFGSAQNVFEQDPSTIEDLTSYGKQVVANLHYRTYQSSVEAELEFIEKHSIKYCLFTQESYPERLKQCYDCPLVLYYKGDFDFDATKMLSIVGTRKASSLGRELCEQLLTDLKQLGHKFTIVSGLALGIDGVAHRTALKLNLPTIGVLAHGLGRLYPSQHLQMAQQMLQQGGLVTEFRSFDPFRRGNFISRNRLIAGLTDCVVLVESGLKGGALTTLEFANGYSREAFAFPGRYTDANFQGCNGAIQNAKAHILTSAQNLSQTIGWEPSTKATVATQQLPLLDEKQRKVLKILQKNPLPFDAVLRQANFSRPELTTLLLEMEMLNFLEFLPGNAYKSKLLID